MKTLCSPTGRPDTTLLLGPTGVGKTPLATLCCEQGLSGEKVQHFDFGEELRRISNGSVGLCTDQEARFIRTVLEQGVLLEDEHFSLALKIFKGFLARVDYQKNDHVMLNGLPRHLGQARAMESAVRVVRLVVLHCEPWDVYERIRNNTAGDRTGRLDDSVPMIHRKLEIFRARTEPLVVHYRETGIPVIRLSVGRSDSAWEIYQRLASSLQEHVCCSIAGSPSGVTSPVR